MKRFALAGLTLSLCLLAAAALAADTSARAQLHAFASGLHSLSGQFQQTLTNANGQRIKSSRGTVALKAPHQFRWQTTAPYQQLIVADGAHVWMYEPDLDQVTVRKQSTAAAHSPLTVLTDIDRLDSDFKTTKLGARDGLQWLRLTPTDKQAHFAYAELGFSDGSLRAMQFKDQLGNITRIRFSHWKRNQTLPASTFDFTPPKGTDVIGDTSSVSDVKPLRN